VFLYRAGLIQTRADKKNMKNPFINLQNVNLSGAYLTMNQLGGANFEGADLRGAILRKTSLRGTNLKMAQLQGADLQDADLTGADLRGTAPPKNNASNAQQLYTKLCGAKLDESAIKKLVESTDESKKVKANAQTIWPSSPCFANSD